MRVVKIAIFTAVGKVTQWNPNKILNVAVAAVS
jgi:hypothetical protein